MKKVPGSLAALSLKKEKKNGLLAIFFILPFLVGCAPMARVKFTGTPAPITPTSTATATLPTFTPSSTFTPLFSPTERPFTLVFYGDSVLKVGDINQPAEVGFSIVDPLRDQLPGWDHLVISNHGGRRAKWGYENLEQNVLNFQPDLVTLWWGMNDLGGCPGIFNRESNALLQVQLTALIKEHIEYMKAQIRALLDQKITIFVITPLPVLGDLPWTHFDADNQLVWEEDHRCNFNLGLEQLVQAQRRLVAGFSDAGEQVYLVDAWQVYKDNPNADKMYMDVVHPASHGAALIAAEWLRVFQSIDFQR